MPHGSNLGPLLLLIYINDLPNAWTKLSFILFADDTNPLASYKSLDELIKIANQKLSLIYDWFRANRLSLNILKIHFILFRSYGKTLQNVDLTLTIDGINITQVESVKFLGVMVDEHLNWRVHVANIGKQIAKNIGILSKVAYLLPVSTLINLYHTLIHLAYCIVFLIINIPCQLRYVDEVAEEGGPCHN